VDKTKSAIIFLVFFITFSGEVAAQKSDSSQMSENQAVVSGNDATAIISKIQEALDKPFYEMGEASMTDVVNRRLSDLDYKPHILPPQPFQVPGPPKLPKLPELPQHLRQPSAQQIRVIQKIHSPQRITIPHKGPRRTPPRPPKMPKLPPQSRRRR